MGQVPVNAVITERALRGLFLQTAQATAPHPLMQLVDFVPSTNLIEKYAGLGEVSEMVEFTDNKAIKGLVERSFTLENKRYHATHRIHKDAIRLDQTGTAQRRVADMTRTGKLFPAKLVSELVSGGITTGNNSYDATVFFSATHPAEGDAPAQANRLSLTGTSAANFQTDFRLAIGALREMKDASGKPVNEGVPMELVVVVPSELEGVAREILLANLFSNTTNVDAGRASLIVDGRLTTANDWFLFNVAGGKPFVLQENDPLQFMYLGEGTETFFMTGYATASVEWMGRAGYQWWQRAIMIG